MKFTVYIEDNFHYMDPGERHLLGEFDTEEEAVAAAKQVVDSFLEQPKHQNLPADKLFELFTTFGEEPWITPGSSFSAWEYARQRCSEIALE